MNKLITSILCTFLIFPLVFNDALARKGKKKQNNSGFGSAAKYIGGIKNYDANTLSIVKLKNCIRLERKIHRYDDKLSEQEKSLKLLESDVSRNQSSTQELKQNLNKNNSYYSGLAFDSYDNLVTLYNLSVGSYNASLKIYKDFASMYNNLITTRNIVNDKFKTECNGKSYYRDDYKQAYSELGLAKPK